MNEIPPGAPASAPALPPEKKVPGKTAARWESPLFICLAAVVLAVLLFFGLGYLVSSFTHESTDDAFIAGHIISISPRIAGQVSAVHVSDNQFVHSNDLLLEIDPADFAVTVAQKEAAASSQEANFNTVIAAYELMRAKVATAEAGARKAQADADASGAKAKKSAADFARAENLQKQNTLSQQEFDASRAANVSAQADWKSALENAAEENSKVDEAVKQLATVLAQKDMAFAQSREAQTNVSAAKLTLSYTKIFAPADGRVTRKQVEAGDFLQAGQQIFSLVPTNVWVAANFKESQLKKMASGQPAIVEVDALGRKKFRAHVESVQAGSGAAFSLLPPENASGNFVKVIQRVPVKIIFDEPLPADKTLGPGLSVTPSVQIRSFTVSEFVLALVAIVLATAAALICIRIIRRAPTP